MLRAHEQASHISAVAVIRGMFPGDVPALLSILKESPEASLWSEANLLESASSGTAWVAEREGRVVGFIIGRKVADEFEILNLAVARLHRRHGIAMQMVKLAVEWSRTSGAQRVFLEVRASNEAAMALYVGQGFGKCGSRTRYYRNPIEDAIVLSCATQVKSG